MITAHSDSRCELRSRWHGAFGTVLGSGVLLTTVTSEGTALSNALLDLAIQLSVVYIIALPLLAETVLPRVGIDRDPSGYGIQTWVAFPVVAIWYCIGFVIPIAFLAFVLALPVDR